MLRRRSYLVESILNMQRDVDWIYKTSGLERFMKAIQTGDQGVMKGALKDDLLWITDSSKLRSRVARKAHRLNPVGIRVAAGSVAREGSYYKPAFSLVQIVFPNNALALLRQMSFDLDKAVRHIGQQGKRLKGEFTAQSIKGTIYHELSHWASDTLHNRYIAQRLQHAQEHGVETIKGKFRTVTLTPMEIDAQIHAIQATKKELGGQAYNRLSWIELLTKRASLMTTIMAFFYRENYRTSKNLLKAKKDYDLFMKKLSKRMYREGLLSRKLRKIPSHHDMAQIIDL